MILNLYFFILQFSLAKNVTGQLKTSYLYANDFSEFQFVDFFFLICNINLNTTNVIQCGRNIEKLIIYQYMNNSL